MQVGGPFRIVPDLVLTNRPALGLRVRAQEAEPLNGAHSDAAAVVPDGLVG